MHIDGPNVKAPRDIDEATAREELASMYEARAARFRMKGLLLLAAENVARAAEIRKGKT
jgi:hypothetical protein